MKKKNIRVCYFAMVGEKRGIQTDPYETDAATARQLLHEIEAGRTLPLTTNISKALINGKFAEWDDKISDGDLVTLLSPFSGG